MYQTLITGNKNKLAEFQKFFPEIQSLDIDLPEIQSLDPHEIQKFKLQTALQTHSGPLIVEDTSFYLDCLNGFPGPLIKWFLESVGTEGLFEIADKYKIYGAQVLCLIGYATESGEIKYFEGKVVGNLVEPRTADGFQFDRIFVPNGFDQTYSQMTIDLKNTISHRGLAMQKLNEYLN